MTGIILITGAAGRIGTVLRGAWKGRFPLRLLDRVPIEGEDSIVADLADFPSAVKAVEGVHTVLHLAADIRGSNPWPDIVHDNIVASYNVFEAAKDAGVRRIIFASTIQVISGYPRDQFVTLDMPTWPTNPYALSKVFGESLSRYYNQVHGLSVICIRIGAFQESWRIGQDENLRWCLLSARDAVQLFTKVVEVKDVEFAILFGLSDNPVKHGDLEPTRRLLGYSPEDSPDKVPL